MSELRCTCGTTIQGAGEGLLSAVERHLATDHHPHQPIDEKPKLAHAPDDTSGSHTQRVSTKEENR